MFRVWCAAGLGLGLMLFNTSLVSASCTPAGIGVALPPLLAPSNVIPVVWAIDGACEVVETGALVGRDVASLAPAGEPFYGRRSLYQRDLPVEESGEYWIAAYARDEAGAVVRSVPRPVVVFVPAVFPADPHGSHGAPPSYAGDDSDFLRPAGEPHYASLRQATTRNRRFVRQQLTDGVRVSGFDVRTVASTRRDEVLAGQAEPLEVGGRLFALDPGAVRAALDQADALFGFMGYPRTGLYVINCAVAAQYQPAERIDGPTCGHLDFLSTGWVAYGDVSGSEGFQSIQSTLAYFIPAAPEGKRLGSARLRAFAFRQRGGLSDIPLNGKVPVAVEPTACFASVCSGWVTWDFTEEARALSAQGGGELAISLDPVPPVDGLANYGLSPAANYPWAHGNENHALTLTFEEACPRELEVAVAPSVVRPVVPAWLSSKGVIISPTIKGAARAMPTETMVEATVTTCAAEEEAPQPVEVTFEVLAPATGSADAAGHLHSGALRPTGLIQDIDRGQPADRCTVSLFTDGRGSCAVTYRAGEVSGVETIVARAEGFADVEAKVTIRVPGLHDLRTFPSDVWRLTGARPGLHTDSHWATANTMSRATLMAVQVYEDYSASMGVNDMSLTQGGMFDIEGDWNGAFHRTHRLGTGVDVDGCALSLIPDNPNPRSNDERNCEPGWVVLPRADYFSRVCKEHGGRLANESTIHCEFPE